MSDLAWLVEPCTTCNGTGEGCTSGGQHELDHRSCSTCGGSGVVPSAQATEVVAEEIVRWGIKPEKLPAGQNHLARLVVLALLEGTE